MTDRPVVITGAAIVSAVGTTAPETWAALLAGGTGIRAIDAFDARGFACRVAAQVRGLDRASLDVHPRWARILDLHSYMLLKCSRDAFAEARLGDGSVPREEIGCFLGMGMVDYHVEDLLPAVVASLGAGGQLDLDAFYAKAYQEIYPLWPLSTLNNISLCQVAIDLGICGENAVFAPDADAGAQAIIEGVEALRARRARALLAGGVSDRISPPGLARAHLQGVLNTREGDDGAACRPFAANRKGTILGEGCGLLALELRASADQRGARYTTAIAGYGTAFEAAGGSPGPTADAIARAMADALRRADLGPSDIDVVIAHGDGTESGDRREADALHRVFAGSLEALRVFASKGALGHLLAGAPAVDLVLGTYMVNGGAVPPTLHAEPPDAEFRFHLVGGQPLRTRPRRVMVNCRGQAGGCASLILEALR